HSGMVFSVNEYEDTWKFIRHRDGKIHLEIPEMISALSALDPSEDQSMRDYPFVLSAGERRSYNANTIYRDPSWRKNDPDGALRIHPDDATQLGILNGEWVRCESKRGSVIVQVNINDADRKSTRLN